jgi:hypothetical protein
MRHQEVRLPVLINCHTKTTRIQAEARMGTMVVCAQPERDQAINDRKPGYRPGEL